MNMNKRSALILSIIFLLTVRVAQSRAMSCSGNLLMLSNNNDTVIIKINIKNGERAAFYYNDEFGVTDPPFFLTGKDHLKKIIIDCPTLLIDAYHQIPFLIYPGDKLTLRVENDIPILSIDNNDIRNNDLLFFVTYYKKYQTNEKSGLLLGKNSFSLYSKSYDYHQTINQAKTDSIKRFEFLDSYRKTSVISPGFSLYANNFFRYLYVMDMLSTLTLVGVDISNLPGGYVKRIDKLNVRLNCDSCLLNEAYRRADVFMAQYISRSFKYSDKRFSLSYDTISSYFTGSTRRHVLFTWLKDHMPAPPAEYEAKLNSFLKEKTDLYSSYLLNQQDMIKRFKADQNLNKELASPDGNKITWSEMISKYKGYLIYVDFWASWCVPCRQMIPLSQSLERSYKDKKIKFIYLSIDDSPSDWKKAMSDEHISPDDSYFLINQKKSALKKQYNITSIPHYLLISKTGVIVDANAPYPNNLQIKKFLAGYLGN